MQAFKWWVGNRKSFTAGGGSLLDWMDSSLMLTTSHVNLWGLILFSKKQKLIPGNNKIYNIICIRYHVNTACKLRFCCSLLYMRLLLHVGPSWAKDPSFMKLLPSFFLFKSFFNIFFSINMTSFVAHCTDCKAHWGNVIVILGFMNKKGVKL